VFFPAETTAVNPPVDFRNDFAYTPRHAFKCRKIIVSRMYWLILVFSLFPLLGFFVLGIFLLYSAITGRGMTPPQPEDAFVLHLRYRLRGLIGLVFTLVSAYSLWKLVILGFTDLK
jgi:hypothetical protein